MDRDIANNEPDRARNKYDLQELAGAFGDLGTLIPFVVAYISLLKMDPGGILLAFGSGLIVVGLVYKTPFPVQPMKAIGAAALTQTAGALVLTPMMVAAAGLMTALLWFLLAATGLVKRLARWIPRSALLGVVMGLGFSFMLEGIRMMAQSWVISVGLLALTLVMLARSRLPAMVVLILVGAVIAVVQQPALLDDLALIKPALHLPAFTWPSTSGQDLWLGLVLLALPQLPLTFGNALIAW